MSQESRRFLKKILLFLSPFIIYFSIESCVLPVNFFNFRVWEALRVYTFAAFLPGPFYPHQHLVSVEEGDLGHGTAWATRTATEWWTDEFGYRNKPGGQAPQVVVVGDSFTAGSGLTQTDTLPSQLGERLHQNVYNFAPADMNIFLNEKRFILHPPRIVVLAVLERNLTAMPLWVETPPPASFGDYFARWARGVTSLQPLWVTLDRFQKMPGLHYLNARLFDIDPYALASVPAGPLLFFPYDLDQADLTDVQISKMANLLILYRDTLRQRGIGFVFLPIPTKESVYYLLRQDGREPKTVPRLVRALQDRNMKCVDLQKTFIEASRKTKKFLYRKDDTHWNVAGVRIAASLLADQIQNRPEFKTPPSP